MKGLYVDITYQFSGNKEKAFEIRRKVFIDEQGFKDEFDAIDEDALMTHVTAYCDGILAGCARIFPSDIEPKLEPEEGRWVLGRLAVLPEYRKFGFGSKIMKASEDEARARGARQIVLHAQCRARPFYQKLGYEPFGPIEFEEHVEHQWMKKNL